MTAQIDRYRRWTSFALACSTLVVCFGCGAKSDLEKVTVRGRVTYQGEPVANGEIRFFPLPGTRGPTSGAPIKDGEYIANLKGGVPVGKQQVHVRGFRASSGDADDMLAPAGARVQYLPPEYNDQTTLECEIPASSSEVTHDFELK